MDHGPEDHDDALLLFEIGQRLESVRKERGLTQRDFAAMIGAPLNTYTNWVCGKRCPGAMQIVRTCRALDVGAGWLLGTSDALENRRHEAFCRIAAEDGKPAYRIYMEVYGTENAATARANASRIAARTDVRERCEWMRSQLCRKQTETPAKGGRTHIDDTDHNTKGTHMKRLTRVDMTDEEAQAIERAQQAVAAVLRRIAEANADKNRPTAGLVVMLEPDYNEPHPWPLKTVTRWTLDMTDVGHASAASFPEALDKLCGPKEKVKVLEQAAKYRAEAERLEKEAAQMAEDGGQKTEGCEALHFANAMLRIESTELGQGLLKLQAPFEGTCFQLVELLDKISGTVSNKAYTAVQIGRELRRLQPFLEKAFCFKKTVHPLAGIIYTLIPPACQKQDGAAEAQPATGDGREEGGAE